MLRSVDYKQLNFRRVESNEREEIQNHIAVQSRMHIRKAKVRSEGKYLIESIVTCKREIGGRIVQVEGRLR